MLSSRCAHGTLTVLSGYAHVKLMACWRYAHGTLTSSSWRVHGMLMVRSGYSHVKVTVPSRYAQVNLTLRSRCPYGTLVVRSGYSHVKVTVPSRYAHGTLTSSSWSVHDTLTVPTRSIHGQTKHYLRVLKRIWSWPYRACEVIAKVDNPSDTQLRTSNLLLTATWLSIWCKLCLTYLQGNYVYGRRSLIKFYHIFILSHPTVLQRSCGYEIKYNTTVRHNSI